MEIFAIIKKRGRINLIKIAAKCALLVLLALFISASVGMVNYVVAQETGVDLHIKVEASRDNGSTWHNYSGTESSGGETVSVDPGDTV